MEAGDPALYHSGRPDRGSRALGPAVRPCLFGGA